MRGSDHFINNSKSGFWIHQIFYATNLSHKYIDPTGIHPVKNENEDLNIVQMWCQKGADT